MVTYLDRILQYHRAAAEEDSRDIALLCRQAEQVPGTRGFANALRSQAAVSVIAEIKRASPSRGLLCGELDPAAVAREYETGGAACLSVLTDWEFFSGSPHDLVAARAGTSLPVLRKDFTVCPADVCDARLMGADAVLLIVAALSPTELAELVGLARRLRLDALVEVHDEDEAAVALAAGAEVVGINQRDLYTFEVDTARAERVAKVLPPEVVRVAESGVRGPDDLRRLGDAGFDAVLVGEALVTASDRVAVLRRMRGG